MGTTITMAILTGTTCSSGASGCATWPSSSAADSRGDVPGHRRALRRDRSCRSSTPSPITRRRYQVPSRSSPWAASGGRASSGAGRAKWMFLPNAHTASSSPSSRGARAGRLRPRSDPLRRLAVLGVRTTMRPPTGSAPLLAAGINRLDRGPAIINVGAVTGALLSPACPALRVVRRLGAAVHHVRTGGCSTSPGRPVSPTRPKDCPVYALVTAAGRAGASIPPPGRSAGGPGTPGDRSTGSQRRQAGGDGVPAAGFTIDVPPGRGLQRAITIENVSVVLKTTRAFDGDADRASPPARGRGRVGGTPPCPAWSPPVLPSCGLF